MFFLAGQTPLFLSSIHGRAAATRYLLNHGSNPAIDKTVLPLHGAAVKGLSVSFSHTANTESNIYF